MVIVRMKPQLATSNERHDSTKISLPATKRVKGQNMKRTGISILLFATLLAANVVAQTVHGLPPAKEQLKILTDKLGLTADQQSKAEPIIRDLHDATLKLMGDRRLTQEERLNRVRPLRLNADKKLREILSDDQKKKLDAYEHGPHDEMHGELTGHPSAEQAPKQ
jgi:hypothetical protein